MPYLKQTNPFVVPTTDNKLIEEHYGLASSGDGNFSIAHMIAPPNWSEPFQSPAFDEVTIVIKGQKQFEVDGETIILKAGETIMIRKGSKVRYSNPFAEPCEYWSCCVPAFSIATVNREGEQDEWMDIE
jgi:mannose-6-phosphate isomerase-like protein (cupin superfamily)